MTVLRRQRPGRPRLLFADRLLWVWLYRIWPKILDAMVQVKPATVVQWHRKGFRLYWRRRSLPLGRPGVSREIRDLIGKMSQAKPLWGAPRIHGKLLKLDTEVSQATVGRCKGRLIKSRLVRHATPVRRRFGWSAGTDAATSPLQDAVRLDNLASTSRSLDGFG